MYYDFESSSVSDAIGQGSFLDSGFSLVSNEAMKFLWLIFVLTFGSASLFAKNSVTETQKEPSSSSRLVVSSDALVTANEVYDTIVVVAGHLDMFGKTDTLVVVAGKASLKRGSEIRDSAVVVGGTLDQEEGALLPKDGIQGIGSSITDASGVASSSRWRDWVVKEWNWDNSKFDNVIALLGFIFKITIAAIALLVLFSLLFMAPRFTERPQSILKSQPWKSFFLGLLASFGIIPLCVLLAITVIGILVIPFVGFFYMLAFLIGLLAVCHLVGAIILGDNATRWISALVGLVAILAASMIPIFGEFIIFVLGATGVGATLLAFIEKRRNVVTVRDYVSYQI